MWGPARQSRLPSKGETGISDQCNAQKVSVCRRTNQPDCYPSKLGVEARHKNENSLIADWAIVSERQNFLEQFIDKSLLLFEKREMAGIFKPDEFLYVEP